MKIWHWLSRKPIEHYVFRFRTSTFWAFFVHEGKYKLTHWPITLWYTHVLEGSSAPSFPPSFSVLCSSMVRISPTLLIFDAPFSSWWSNLWLENFFFGKYRLPSYTPPYSQHWQHVSTWWCGLHIHNSLKKNEKKKQIESLVCIMYSNMWFQLLICLLQPFAFPTHSSV